MVRHKSTLSREISRGKLSRAGYRPLTAQFYVEQQKHITRRPKKVQTNPVLTAEIQTYLKTEMVFPEQ